MLARSLQNYCRIRLFLYHQDPLPVHIKIQTADKCISLNEFAIILFFLLGRSRAVTSKRSSWCYWALCFEREVSYRCRTATSSSWSLKVMYHQHEDFTHGPSYQQGSGGVFWCTALFLSLLLILPCPAPQHTPSWKGIMTLHLEVQEEVGAPQQCRLTHLREKVYCSAEQHLPSSTHWSLKRLKGRRKIYY